MLFRYFSLAFLIIAPQIIMGAVIHIPGDYTTIQSGIDAAADYDTVVISNTTYYEHLTISKPLTLTGQSIYGTVIDGSGTGDIITITHDYVNIHLIEIRNAGSTINNEDDCDAAIEILYSDYCSITSCKIIDNPAAGLALTGSEHCKIRHCQFENNHFGIYFYEAGGFESPCENDFGNTIEHNHFYSNDRGINFEHTACTHHHTNTVAHNIFESNGYALTMIMSQENRIHSNLFKNSVGPAIILIMCSGGGESNLYYLNSFINNGTGYQALDYSQGSSYWYSYSVGNYWSDYDGIDANQDGIGDTPYDNIGDPPGMAIDYFPLMAMQDNDGDGLPDSVDNCPGNNYPLYNDRDFDGVGDHCDNCLFLYNPDQIDSDENGIGDACTTICGDASGDGVVNLIDILHLISYLYDNPRGVPPLSFVYSNVNSDSNINLLDILYLIEYLYGNPPGPEPDCPDS